MKAVGCEWGPEVLMVNTCRPLSSLFMALTQSPNKAEDCAKFTLVSSHPSTLPPQGPDEAEDGPPELLFIHGGHTSKVWGRL